MRSKKADVRIIAATNKDLSQGRQDGTIREDFFYRIQVIVIELPPLREHKEDIPLLIDHFLTQYGQGKECVTLPARIMEQLCAYHWPGNIRELQNVLQRYLAEQDLGLSENAQSMPEPPADAELDLKGQDFYEAVEAFEKRVILNALKQNLGRRDKTAAMLNILPRTLYRKIQKYDLLK